MLAVLAAATSGVNQASGSRFAMLTNADKEAQIEPLMAQVFPKASWTLTNDSVVANNHADPCKKQFSPVASTLVVNPEGGRLQDANDI